MNKIKHSLMWLFLLTKRYFKKPMFIFTIFMIPVFVLILGKASGTDESIIKVALYVEEAGTNELADEIVLNLTKDSDSTILFYQVETADDLKLEVLKGNATCGYMFPADFASVVKDYTKGYKANLPFKNAMIKCIEKSDSNYTKIANEVVFSYLYDAYSNEILLNYMLNNEETGTNQMTDEDIALLEEFRNSYEINDTFFTFESANGEENTLLTEGNTGYLMLPLRGMIMALILLASMTGAIMLFKDKEQGMFLAVPLGRRSVINYMYVLIPAFIAGVVGFIGIMFTGTATNITNEIVIMAVYIPLVAGVSNLFRRLCKSQTVFVSIIPIYIIMNVILCPVFVNLSTLLPEIKYVQKLLPVYYGLNSLYSVKMVITMLIISIALMCSLIKDEN